MEVNGQPLTPEQEAALVAAIPPALLLDALRASGGAAERVFAGFRRNADSLKRPLVRERLQREVGTRPELQACVWELWRHEHAALISAIEGAEEGALAGALPGLARQWGHERVALALLADAREAARALAPQVAACPAAPPEPAKPREREPRDDRAAARLREQVAEVKQQAAALRAHLAQERKESARLRAQADDAARQAQLWKVQLQESARQATEAQRAAERWQRRVERLQRTKAEMEERAHEAARTQRRLERDLEGLRRQEEARARAEAARKAALPPADSWLRAARELVRQGQAPAAVAFLAHLARKHPQSPAVREVLAEAYQAAGAAHAAVTEWCWVARWQHQQGRAAEAVDPACRALAAAPGDPEARRCLAETAAALGPDAGEAWATIASHLAALEGAADALRAAEQIRAGAGERPGAARPRLDLDAPLPWPRERGAFTASLRTIIAAIDANDAEVVRHARRALALMRQRAPETRQAILEALKEYDDSYRSVLVRHTRPVVVDGSNVAWYGRGEPPRRPRLDYLQAIRRELRSLGYFPIHLYVDAALVYQIDQRPQLERLMARREVIAADAGTDADEQILSEARAIGCEVVTNDRMQEHDPGGQVRKLRFEIDRDGAVVREWPRG